MWMIDRARPVPVRLRQHELFVMFYEGAWVGPDSAGSAGFVAAAWTFTEGEQCKSHALPSTVGTRPGFPGQCVQSTTPA